MLTRPYNSAEMALSASSGLSEGFCGESVQVRGYAQASCALAIDGIHGGSTGRGARNEELVRLESIRSPGWGLEAVGKGRDATTLRATEAAQGSVGSATREQIARAGAGRISRISRISRDRISGAHAERTVSVNAVRRPVGTRARAKSSKGRMQCRRGPSSGGVIRASCLQSRKGRGAQGMRPKYDRGPLLGLCSDCGGVLRASSGHPRHSAATGTRA